MGNVKFIYLFLFVKICNPPNPSGYCKPPAVFNTINTALPLHSVSCVFCVLLETNSDYLPIDQQLIGLYNWDGLCSLWCSNCE